MKTFKLEYNINMYLFIFSYEAMSESRLEGLVWQNFYLASVSFCHAQHVYYTRILHPLFNDISFKIINFVIIYRN